jgi:hypothetical protein
MSAIGEQVLRIYTVSHPRHLSVSTWSISYPQSTVDLKVHKFRNHNNQSQSEFLETPERVTSDLLRKTNSWNVGLRRQQKPFEIGEESSEYISLGVCLKMTSALGKWLRYVKQTRLPACFTRPQRRFTLVTGNESCGMLSFNTLTFHRLTV